MNDKVEDRVQRVKAKENKDLGAFIRVGSRKHGRVAPQL